jgi:hypothetical protein
MRSDLFALFRYGHRSGCRCGRSGQYRGCPTFDSTGQYFEILKDVDILSYGWGFQEGRRIVEAIVRDRRLTGSRYCM